MEVDTEAEVAVTATREAEAEAVDSAMYVREAVAAAAAAAAVVDLGVNPQLRLQPSPHRVVGEFQYCHYRLINNFDRIVYENY